MKERKTVEKVEKKEKVVMAMCCPEGMSAEARASRKKTKTGAVAWRKRA